jgi:predicted O-methyltransferase YrrM
MGRFVKAFEMAAFCRDWVTAHASTWLQELRPFLGVANVQALEVGCFEGRSTLWFLQNILTHPSAVLYCIDPKPHPRYFQNTEPYRQKLRYIRQASQIALRDRGFAPEVFSFAYIDGSHKAADVLEDAVLVFRLVKPGGVIIFDDYAWTKNRPPLDKPQMGIDAFLQVFEGQYRIIRKQYQLVLAKNKTTDMIRQSPGNTFANDYLLRRSSSHPWTRAQFGDDHEEGDGSNTVDGTDS